MVQTIFPRFSDKEYARRRKAVTEMMKKQRVEGLLVFAGPLKEGRIFYLANYVPQLPTWFIYPLDGEPTLLLHMYNHIQNAMKMSITRDIRWYGPDAVETIARVFGEKKLQESRVGVVGLADIVPYDAFVRLKSALPRAIFQDVTRPYDAIREIKSEEEIEWHRRSAHLTDLAMEALGREIRPGLTRYDLSSIVHSAFVPKGGHMGIHYISSTSMDSPSVTVPWQFLTPEVISKGDVVITEITIKYWTYESQLHRPFGVAREPTQLYQGLFDVALECYERVAKAIRPGSTTEDVLNASSIIEERGFRIGDSLVHGCEAGKHPELGTRNSVYPPEPYTFKENTVVIIQPLPVDPVTGAGLQLGSATLVTQSGAKSIHDYPMRFTVCRA